MGRSTLVLLLLLPAFPGRARAQRVDALVQLSGTVYDSVTSTLLIGALVQFRRLDSLSSRAYDATSDEKGRFAVSLPRGRYLAGVSHALYDSLGIDLPTREIEVSAAGQTVVVASPSPKAIVRALCPGTVDSSTTGVFLGHIRDASTGETRGSASIAVAWIDWTTKGTQVAADEKRVETRTSADGWYGVCSLPHGTPLVISVRDSSRYAGTITLQIEPNEVRHLPIFVGEARAVTDSASTASGLDGWWRGSHLINGTVIGDDGAPIPGVTVALEEAGIEGTTGRDGSFRLEGLPGGSWMLTARKPGYEPSSKLIRVTSVNEVARLTLARTPSRLSTVEVTGASRELRLSGFRSRMSDAEKGVIRGHFITEETIQKRRGTAVTNLLEGLSGVRVSKHPNSGDFRKRVVYGVNMCRMTVYLDEIRILPKLDGKTPDELNELVSSTDLAGIEVYPSMGGAPAKYQALNGTCGVVLLWSK